MKKRAVSFLLVIAMLLTLLPAIPMAPASAEALPNPLAHLEYRRDKATDNKQTFRIVFYNEYNPETVDLVLYKPNDEHGTDISKNLVRTGNAGWVYTYTPAEGAQDEPTLGEYKLKAFEKSDAGHSAAIGEVTCHVVKCIFSEDEQAKFTTEEDNGFTSGQGKYEVYTFVGAQFYNDVKVPRLTITDPESAKNNAAYWVSDGVGAESSGKIEYVIPEPNPDKNNVITFSIKVYERPKRTLQYEYTFEDKPVPAEKITKSEKFPAADLVDLGTFEASEKLSEKVLTVKITNTGSGKYRFIHSASYSDVNVNIDRLSQEIGNNEAITVTLTMRDNCAVGEHEASIWLFDTESRTNHAQFVVKFEIEPVKLNVTPEDVTVHYGETVPSSQLGYKITRETPPARNGQLTDEDLASMKLEDFGLTLESDGLLPNAKIQSEKYPFTLKGAASPSYEIKLVEGHGVTVAKATPEPQQVNATGVLTNHHLRESNILGVFINPYTKLPIEGDITWDDEGKQLSATGNQNYTFTPDDNEHYENYKGTTEVVVSDKWPTNLTVKPDSRLSVEYDGKQHPVEFLVNNGSQEDREVTVEYAPKGTENFSAEAPKNAGTYTVKATVAADGDYAEGSGEAELTITPRKLMISLNSTIIAKTRNYDGTVNAEPSGSVGFYNMVVAGDDLHLSMEGCKLEYYSASVGSGKNATLTVVDSSKALAGASKDNYTLSEKQTLHGKGTITSRPIEIYVPEEKATSEYGQPVILNESTFELAPSQPYGGLVDGETKADIHAVLAVKGVSAFSKLDVGTYEIRAYAGSNYSMFTPSVGNFTVKAATPTNPSINVGSGVEGTKLQDIDISGSYLNPHDKSIIVNGTFEWKEPNKEITVGSHEYEYTFTPSDSNHTKVEGTVAVVGHPIEKTAPDITVNLPASLEYDGNAKTVTVESVSDGAVTIEYKSAGENDSAYKADAPKSAGNYDVRVKVAESRYYHAAEKVVQMSITTKHITLSDNVSVEPKTYDGTNAATLRITDLEAAKDIVSGDRVELNNNLITATFDTAGAGTGKTVTVAIGHGALTGEDAGNYHLNAESFTIPNQEIKQREIEVTVSADKQSKFYGQSVDFGAESFSVSGLVKDEDALVTLSSDGAEAKAGVKSYDINAVCANPNYVLKNAKVGTLTVNKTVPQPSFVTASVIGTGRDLTYSKLSYEFVNPYLTEDKIVEGDIRFEDDALSLSEPGTIAAKYVFTPTDGANYETAKGDVNVNVTNLQESDITLPEEHNLNRTYNGAEQAVKFNVEPAEREAELKVEYRPSGSEDEQAWSEKAPVNVGTYEVRASLEHSATHSADTANATLTINPVELTVATVDGVQLVKDKVYDASLTGEVDLSALKLTGAIVSGEESGLEISAEGVSAAFADANAAEGVAATVTVDGAKALSGEKSSNYILRSKVISEGVSANIAKRPVTVTVPEMEKEYGELHPLSSDSVNVEGLQGGDGNAVLGLTVTSDGTGAEAGAGSYDVEVTASEECANYTVPSEIDGKDKLTVVRAVPEVQSVVPAVAIAGKTLESVDIQSYKFVNKHSGAEVEGSIRWKTPSTVLTDGENECEYVFTPEDIDNYEELTASVFVTANVINKQTPNIQITLPSDLVYDGEAKAASFTTDAEGASSAIEYAKVTDDARIWSADAPKDAGTYEVRATVYGNDYWYEQSVSQFMVIKQAEPNGTVSAEAVENGSYLSASALSHTFKGVGGETLEGSLVWENIEGQPADAVIVNAETDYAWIFMPSDSNYASKRGTARVSLLPNERKPESVTVYNLHDVEETFTDYAYITVDDTNVREGDIVCFYKDASRENLVSEIVPVTAEDARLGRVKVTLDSDALEDAGGKIYAALYYSTAVAETDYPAELGFALSVASVDVVFGEQTLVNIIPSDKSYQVVSSVWSTIDESIISANAQPDNPLVGVISGLAKGPAAVTVVVRFRHPDPSVDETIDLSANLTVNVKEKEKPSPELDIVLPENLVYDGTEKAASYNLKTVGAGECTVEYLAESGSYTTQAPKSAGSYTVRVTVAESETYKSAVFTAKMDISPKHIDLHDNITVADKVYDGTNAATLSIVDLETAKDIISGDVVALDNAKITATFDSANAGEGKTVNVVVGSDSLTGRDSGNYYLDGAGFTLTGKITPMSVTVTVNPDKTHKLYGQTVSFDDASFTVSATANDEPQSALQISLSSDGAAPEKAVGSYDINAVCLNTNYTLAYSKVGTLEVGKATPQLSYVEASGIKVGQTLESSTLKGEFINPHTMKPVSGDLAFAAPKTSFETAGTHKADYTFTVSGEESGNYEQFTGKVDVKVSELDPTVISLPADHSLTRTYSGESQTVEFTVEPASRQSELKVQYKPVGTDAWLDTAPTDAGSYEVLATVPASATNASAEYRVTLSISPKSVTIKAADGVKPINGKTYDGLVKAELNLSGFTLEGVISADESKVSLNEAGFIANFESPNAGEDVKAVINVKGAEALSGEKSGCYVLTDTVIESSAKISKAEITVTLEPMSKHYGESAAASASDAEITGLKNNESADVLGLSFNSEGFGSEAQVREQPYDVNAVIGANDNYTLSSAKAGEITVVKTAPTKSYVNASGLKVGAAVGSSTLTGEFTNEYTGKKVEGSLTFVNGSEVKNSAGSYSVEYSFKPFDEINYEQVSGNVEVIYSDLDPTEITLKDGQSLVREYSGAAQAVEFTVDPASRQSELKVEYRPAGTEGDSGWSTNAPTGAGSYEVRAVLAANAQYAAGSASATLTVNPKPVTVSGKAGAALVADKTYDGLVKGEVNAANIELSGVIEADRAEVSLDASAVSAVFAAPEANESASATVKVPAAALTGAKSANYTLADTEIAASAAIKPAAVTVSYPAAEKKFGETFSFTEIPTVTGLAAGETAAVLGLSLSCDGAAPEKAVGSYDITAAITSGNYTLSSDKAGSLTVSQAEPLEGDVTATGIKLGQSLERSEISGEFMNPYTLEEVHGEVSFAEPETVPEEIGFYTAQYVFKPEDDHNYSELRGSVQVHVADLEQTAIELADAASLTRDYTGAAQTVELNVTPESRKSELTVKYRPLGSESEDDWSDAAPIDAGSYEVLASIPASETHTAARRELVLVIKPIEVKIKAVEGGKPVENKTYDGTAAATVNAAALELEGVLAADREAVSIDPQGLSAAFESVNAAKSVKANITVSGSAALKGAKSANYTLADCVIAAEADIARASVSVTVPDLTKFYGQNLPLSAADAEVTGLASGESADVLGLTVSSEGSAASAPAAVYEIKVAVSELVENYEIASETAGKLTVEKTVPVESSIATGIANEGMSLGDVAFASYAFRNPYNDEPVSGTIAWKNADTVLEAGTHEYEYVFTPDEAGSANHTSAEGRVSLTVTSAEPPAGESYNVAVSISNGGHNAPAVIEKGRELSFELRANQGYKLPESIAVKVNGEEVEADKYSYNSASGHVSIPAVLITGPVSVSAVCVEDKDSPTSYKVTVTVSNGSSNAPASVNSGEQLSFTISADSGYRLPDSISVKVGGTVLSGSEYSYSSATGIVTVPASVISGEVEISAACVSTGGGGGGGGVGGGGAGGSGGNKNEETQTPPSDTQPEQRFDDVPATFWAAADIEYAAEQGWFNGMSEHSFAPQSLTTRGQLVTVLWRLAGEPSASYRGEYPDVAFGEYYTTAVAWGTDAGIVNGTGRGYEPALNVSREQIAVMLWRMQGTPAPQNAETGYNDSAKISDYAKTAMAWATETGLFQGDPSNNVRPTDSATRAEIATLIVRYAEAFLNK